MTQTTYGMVKPEGLEHFLDIIWRIKSVGLAVEESKRKILSNDEFEIIYGHTKSKWFYAKMREYLTTNEIILLSEWT